MWQNLQLGVNGEEVAKKGFWPLSKSEVIKRLHFVAGLIFLHNGKRQYCFSLKYNVISENS